MNYWDCVLCHLNVDLWWWTGELMGRRSVNFGSETEEHCKNRSFNKLKRNEAAERGGVKDFRNIVMIVRKALWRARHVFAFLPSFLSFTTNTNPCAFNIKILRWDWEWVRRRERFLCKAWLQINSHSLTLPLKWSMMLLLLLQNSRFYYLVLAIKTGLLWCFE